MVKCGGSYSEVKCGVLFQIKRAAPRHCVISRWARKDHHRQQPRARMRESCRHPRRSLNPKNVFGRYPQYILHSYARRVHSVLKARWTTFDGNNGLIVTAHCRQQIMQDNISIHQLFSFFHHENKNTFKFRLNLNCRLLILKQSKPASVNGLAMGTNWVWRPRACGQWV